MANNKILLVGKNMDYFKSIVEKSRYSENKELVPFETKLPESFYEGERYFETIAFNRSYESILALAYAIWDTHDGPAWDEYCPRLYIDDKCISEIGEDGLGEEVRLERVDNYFRIDIRESTKISTAERIVGILDIISDYKRGVK